MNTNDEFTLMIIDLNEIDSSSGMDKQTLQLAIDREVTEAFDKIGKDDSKDGQCEVAKMVDVLDGKDKNLTAPVKATQVKKKKNNKNPQNSEDYQYGFPYEPCKPSFGDMVIYLVNKSPIVSINEKLYLYQHSKGYYKALSVEDDTFQRYVLGFCPSWFKREYHTNMNGKIYNDLVVIIEKHYEHRVFENEDIDWIRRNYILTSDCIYEIGTGNIHHGFNPEIPFVRKGLNLWLEPFYNQQEWQYNRYFDTFLEDMSNGSAQIKNLFKGFLGCLFANSEYNTKKIVILYGHTVTIKAITKLLGFFLNKDTLSRIPLDKLTDKYALREIEHKSVNISSHTVSHKLVNELEEITDMLSGEYIYAGNKGDECTILNDKCYILCTDESLDPRALIKFEDYLDGVLLIPIGKAVNKIQDIDDKLNLLSISGGYIFTEAMKARKDLENNDWLFEPLREIQEAMEGAKEVQASDEASEISAFIQYLEERYIIGVDETVKQTVLESDCREYCNKQGRVPFGKAIINEGINTRVCSVFNISAEEYKNTYNKSNRGKNKSVKGDKGWCYIGIGLKKSPN